MRRHWSRELETRLEERLTGTTKGAAWGPERLRLAGRMPHNHDTTSPAGFIHHLMITKQVHSITIAQLFS